MSTKKMLTIIIPTFNSGSSLDKCLEHLDKQTCRDFRVIIIDDNSADQTLTIAKAHQIKAIVKPAKFVKGAAASLNFILAQTETLYVALLDSDAYLADNWVEVMLKLLPKHQIVSAPILADNQNGLVAYLAGLDIESRYENMSPLVRHLSTCNLALQSSILRNFHFDEKLLYAYDSQLSFWLSRQNIKFYLTRETFCYHGNKNSFKNYLCQQYQIAVNHTALAKSIPGQALKGSEVSPWYLIWQLPITVFAIVSLIWGHFFWALVFFILFLLLNSRFFIYLNRKKPYGLIFPAILMIFFRNIVWIAGLVVGLFKYDNIKKEI